MCTSGVCRLADLPCSRLLLDRLGHTLVVHIEGYEVQLLGEARCRLVCQEPMFSSEGQRRWDDQQGRSFGFSPGPARAWPAKLLINSSNVQSLHLCPFYVRGLARRR